MTFLKEQIFSEIVDKGNRSPLRISYKTQFFLCDQCGKDFSRRSQKTKYINANYHFCKKECSIAASKKGGVIYKLKRKNCIEKYGVEHHLSSHEIQQKRISTCLEKFGGTAPMHSQVVKEKAVKTIIDKYGTHFSNVEEIKEKKRTTCLEKYGVSSYSKTDEFKSRIDWDDINKRGYKTRKKNGRSPISKIEKKFGDFLIQNFGAVDAQVEINNWLIDFFIPSLETYVQFDGDYWHGSNMSVEQLLEQANEKPQFFTIAGTKIRDLQKVEWFLKNNKKLVRIKESIFKQKKYDEILSLLKEPSHGL